MCWNWKRYWNYYSLAACLLLLKFGQCECSRCIYACINILPYYLQFMGNTGEFDSVWKEKCALHSGDLTSNSQSGVLFSRGFDHPICPKSGVLLTFLIKSPPLPTHCPRGIVGLTNDRCMYTSTYIPYVAMHPGTV